MTDNNLRGSSALAAAARHIPGEKDNGPTEPPAKRECCGTCRFWKPGYRMDRPGEETGPRFDMHGDDIGHGMCRRKPPVFIPQMIDLTIDPPKMGGQGGYDPDDVFSEIDATNATMFPGTWKHEWCGDFDWREHLAPMGPC